MKWCRRASYLGRFTLWHNGRRATQLGRFTLWHNGRRAKQPGLMQAPGVAHIFQGQWRPCLIQSKILLRVFNLPTSADRPSAIFQLFSTMNDRRLSHLSKRYNDERRLRTHESPRALVRQSEAKRNQAPQSEAKVCRRRGRKCNLEKIPLVIAQDTQ